MQHFYSHGKLLLSGEYVVLDGALSLAIPTKFGQSLKVFSGNSDSNILLWKSMDVNGNIWFKDEFIIRNNEIVSLNTNLNEISNRLIQILEATRTLNPDFLKNAFGFEVITELEFPNFWGLGTSSTLINNIANWANVNAFDLLEMTFGGSGYDIACAQYDAAISYQMSNNKRVIKKVEFNPKFADNLFFIHLNKKQDSRKGIATYNRQKKVNADSVSKISKITKQLVICESLASFESLITEHESIISETIGIKPIKDDLFIDYDGAIKSLGAWGGDFILATGTLGKMEYFKNKGFKTILPYKEMIL